jgi:hypothetical protein
VAARGQGIDARGLAPRRRRRHPVAGVGGQLGEPGAHPADRRAQLVMVQLKHLPEHRSLEHSGQALGIPGHDLRVEGIERAATRAGVGVQ